MTNSATFTGVRATGTPTRELRRQQTERRITRCAQRLTADRGLDGFTMDELAEVAGVSRRTLFNYFPGKLDAVLGAPATIPASDLDVFRAGGPHRHLVDDIGVLARVLLGAKVIDREGATLHQELFCSTPRLMIAAHERFEVLVTEFVELILEREGPAYGAARARLLLRLVVTVFDAALVAFLEDPQERTILEHFDATLATARDLFA